MGVCGSGKSTLGRHLAQAAELRFVAGDDLHPPANIAKMSAGMALTDDDRWPWLDRVAAELRSPGCTVSCSALKRIYRDFIRRRVGRDVLFVLPEVRHEVLVSRLNNRPGHYMPSCLLDSQIAVLQRPEPDELALMVDGTQSPRLLVDEIVKFLAARSRPVRLTAPECEE